MAGVLDERFILAINKIANNELAINKIEKRVIKSRHNHFTQVRNAATEDSHGLIEFKANKSISKCCSIVCHDGSSLYKNTHKTVENER